MTIMTKPRIIPRAAATIAGFALVFASFAPSANAQSIAELRAQLAILQAQLAALLAQQQAPTSFMRDLTIGSSGADVTMLQNWLIARGFAIPAGATGYFGSQTQAALARYQAANGIVPAAGYFGVITRGRVNATIQQPAPEPPQDDEDEDDDDDEDKDNDVSRDDAEEAVEDARDALDDARDEFEEAEDDDRDTNDAEDLLDEAEDLLDDADDEIDDEDYENAVELADEAEDLIDEALDEIEEDDEDEDDDVVSTSAEVNERSGSNNDLAIFEIEVELEAFNQDAYFDRDPDVSVEYEIQDGDGDEVTSFTSESAVLQSSADTEGDYYRLEEDEQETFTLTVTIDPLEADEGDHFRLQLESFAFSDDESSPDQEWDASPSSRFRTDYVYIAD